MKRELTEIDVESVVIKSRLRDDHGDLTTLENSIRKLGLVSPIIVDKDNVLISGGRRLEACRRLGVSKVSALKLDVRADSMTALDIRADENLCREPLSSEELERHIQLKKSAMTGKPPLRGGAGIMPWFKKLFSPR